jgi:hypothetical protein
VIAEAGGGRPGGFDGLLHADNLLRGRLSIYDGVARALGTSRWRNVGECPAGHRDVEDPWSVSWSRRRAAKGAPHLLVASRSSRLDRGACRYGELMSHAASSH